MNRYVRIYIRLQFGPNRRSNGTEMATNTRLLHFLNALSPVLFSFWGNAGVFIVTQETIGLMSPGWQESNTVETP